MLCPTDRRRDQVGSYTGRGKKHRAFEPFSEYALHNHCYDCNYLIGETVYRIRQGRHFPVIYPIVRYSLLNLFSKTSYLVELDIIPQLCTTLLLISPVANPSDVFVAVKSIPCLTTEYTRNEHFHLNNLNK